MMLNLHDFRNKFKLKKKIMAFFVLFFLFGCENTEEISQNKISQEPQIYTLKLEEISQNINLTGNVEANKSIPISAKIMGRIDSLFVDVGDEVKKGQILARYSALDNDSLIQYQSALSQLKSTEASAKNAVNTAEVQVASNKRELNQVYKEEEMLRKKQYDSLYTNAKLSEISISNSLNFLDQNIEGTQKFRGTTAGIIGRNNSIMKNNLKNKVFTLVNEFADFKKEIPSSETSILNFAKFRLNFLKEIKESLLDFDSLIRETVISSNFSKITKDRFISETANYLELVSTAITNLESFISQTKVINEQLGLKILSAENSLKTVESNLELAKSNSENQIVAAHSQVNIAANSQREMIVKAPFTGVIINREIDMGQLVTTGQKMFQVADISSFKIKTDVADNFAGMVKNGMNVKISVDGLDENFIGIVTKINPALDPKTRKLGIEISFIEDKDSEKNILEKLKIGLFARIKMELPTKKVFQVPRSFIKFDYDGAKIKTKDGEIIEVGILSEQENKIEINSMEISENLKITKF